MVGIPQQHDEADDAAFLEWIGKVRNKAAHNFGRNLVQWCTDLSQSNCDDISSRAWHARCPVLRRCLSATISISKAYQLSTQPNIMTKRHARSNEAVERWEVRRQMVGTKEATLLPATQFQGQPVTIEIFCGYAGLSAARWAVGFRGIVWTMVTTDTDQ